MKWFFRLFLSLSFLLFCDYAFTADSPSQDSFLFGQISPKLTKEKGTKTARLSGRHKHKQRHDLPDEELKDDSNESSSHKKAAERENFASHFFYTRVAAINSYHLKAGYYNYSRCIQYPTSNKLYRSISVFRI